MLRKQHPFYTSLSIKNDKQLKMIHITLQFQVIDPLIAYEATKKNTTLYQFFLKLNINIIIVIFRVDIPQINTVTRKDSPFTAPSVQ